MHRRFLVSWITARNHAREQLSVENEGYSTLSVRTSILGSRVQVYRSYKSSSYAASFTSVNTYLLPDHLFMHKFAGRGSGGNLCTPERFVVSSTPYPSGSENPRITLPRKLYRICPRKYPTSHMSIPHLSSTRSLRAVIMFHRGTAEERRWLLTQQVTHPPPCALDLSRNPVVSVLLSQVKFEQFEAFRWVGVHRCGFLHISHPS